MLHGLPNWNTLYLESIHVTSVPLVHLWSKSTHRNRTGVYLALYCFILWVSTFNGVVISALINIQDLFHSLCAWLLLFWGWVGKFYFPLSTTLWTHGLVVIGYQSASSYNAVCVIFVTVLRGTLGLFFQCSAVFMW